MVILLFAHGAADVLNGENWKKKDVLTAQLCNIQVKKDIQMHCFKHLLNAHGLTAVPLWYTQLRISALCTCIPKSVNGFVQCGNNLLPLLLLNACLLSK